MKILCDVCGKQQASVFCCADEAALCDECDNRVHRANKLASKHSRFSLFYSDSNDHSHPLCDICQKKRGFLFCQEDRAILCRDCDASIHSANHLTMKHNRFILSGVQLSSSPISNEEPSRSKNTTTTLENQNKLVNHSKTSIVNGPTTTITNIPIDCNTTTATAATTNSGVSSISEYLIKTCPGWHIEDLLVESDTTTTTFDDFTEVEEFLPNIYDYRCEDLGVIVGDLAESTTQFTSHIFPSATGRSNTVHYQPCKSGKREHRSEDVFMVPQITSHASNTSKRSRQSFLY